MNSKQNLGQYGEWLAKNYLANNGYKILAANYRVAGQGEIDLVCQKGDLIIFAEVKTRTSLVFGWPEEAVGKNKINHLINAGHDYLQKNKIANQWQIDIISVLVKQNKDLVEIKHFENIGLN